MSQQPSILSDQPSTQPSTSSMPSSIPSDQPSLLPSDMPSDQPSMAPSDRPSNQPSVCVDEPGWKLLNHAGEDTGLRCDQMESLCLSVSGSNNPYPTEKDAATACCVCGGGSHVPYGS